MTTITASLVKELRERTGLGMMECKNALVASQGDIEAAIDELRKSSGMKAAKKAGRTAAEGIVVARYAADGRQGMLMEVNSETDFVARDDNFLQFADRVADAAFAAQQTDIAALMDGELEADRQALVQKIGENIAVRRVQFVGEGASCVAGYIHSARIGVLVALQGGDAALGKEIAMHIAAVNPLYVTPEQVPAQVIEREREVVTAQADGSGKPAEIVEKMVQGRLKKFLAEISLVEQPFVKDPDTKISTLLKKANAQVLQFVRFEVGEGIDKASVDFAAEVAAAAKAQ